MILKGCSFDLFWVDIFFWCVNLLIGILWIDVGLMNFLIKKRLSICLV